MRDKLHRSHAGPGTPALTLASATLALLTTGLLGTRPARAEQIVLFDLTYEHTSANDSHHTVSMLEQPASWKTPIDYASGTVHFYQEVMTKPSAANTIVDVCFISMGGYGCIETEPYTAAGVVRTTAAMSSAWQYESIDWTRRMRSIQLIVKDKPGNNNGGRPMSNYLPTRMRFVMTVVSPGGTYVPPPGAIPVDGGADAGADANPADAGTGGAGGGAGAGGSAGQAAAGAGGTGTIGGSGGASAGGGGSTGGGGSSGGAGGSSGGAGGSGGTGVNPPGTPRPGASSSRGCALGGPSGGEDRSALGVMMIALALVISRRWRSRRG